MTITISEVQEIIKNLESGGEISIKEEKYLNVAKLCVQLAAERDAATLEYDYLNDQIEYWKNKSINITEQRNELDTDLHPLEHENVHYADAAEMEIAALRQRIAELESRTVTAAAADVLAERHRQVTAEWWSFKHDDQYKNTELAFAASCYAFHSAAASWDLEDDGIPYDSHPVPKQWPWDPSWWKPTDARRDLVKAGALILAEIERLDRAAGIKVEAE